MSEKAMICPQCNAPLTPHRFAKSAKCPYCGTTVHYDEDQAPPLSASLFHKSYDNWNSPQEQGFENVISIGSSHWALEEPISNDDIFNVYQGMRARWPTELAIIKILKDETYKAQFENEWLRIRELQKSNAPGADFFASMLPQTIIHGAVTGSNQNGKMASVFRRESGFRYNLADVLQIHSEGIPIRASIWLWRRILEMLNFIHTSGMVHGAVLPQHVLIQENEHGARLINYAFTGNIGDSLVMTSSHYAECYPKWFKKGSPLSAQADLVMSARTIISALGGNAVSGSLPNEVPPLLANTIRRVALSGEKENVYRTAWDLREELGQIAEQVYGDSVFIPIDMPVEY
jgi:hypothetical protein